MKDDSVATTVTFIFFILFLVGVFCPVPDWFIGVFVVGLPITINIITSIFFLYRFKNICSLRNGRFKRFYIWNKLLSFHSITHNRGNVGL